LRGGRQKDCANPELRGVRVFACRWLPRWNCPE